MRLRLALVAALCALAAFAAPARVSAANECAGIPRCIPIAGPWVAVPAHGEVEFALECPGGRGIIGGTDAQATSLEIHATFDGIPASPVSFGRTTLSQVLFRAVSGNHKPGAFKPYIGCIPSPSQIQNTISSPVTPVGPPLDLETTIVPLEAGSQHLVVAKCHSGETLVDGWNAIAFTTSAPPDPGLANGIRVKQSISGSRVEFEIFVSEALPRTAHAELQVGARCAQG